MFIAKVNFNVPSRNISWKVANTRPYTYSLFKATILHLARQGLQKTRCRAEFRVARRNMGRRSTFDLAKRNACKPSIHEASSPKTLAFLLSASQKRIAGLCSCF